MPADRTRPSFSDFLSVAVAAGAGLAYEILLLRVFSFSQWHHFASLAVSLAILGFGAAGTTLALMGPRALKRPDRFFLAALGVGAAGMAAAFVLPHLVQVRPLFAVWDGGELGKLLLLDFVSFIPFYALALAIGQVFVRWPEHTARLYAANLGGAGAGAVAACLLLTYTGLENALLTIPGLLAASAAVWAFRSRHGRLCGLFGLLALGLGGWMGAGLPELPVSDFKALSRLKELPEARVIRQETGLRSHLSVVEAESHRPALGLSLRWTGAIPSRAALVLDADRVIPLPWPERGEEYDFLAATLGQLPYELRREGPVAAVGVSGWWGHLRTPGRPVDWIEPDARVARAFETRGLPENVRPRNRDPREFLAESGEAYSVIFYEPSARPGDAAGEEYALTLESLRAALDRLRPGGVLALPMRLSLPPKHMPRMLSMAAEALRGRGVERPHDHALLLRSMREGLLLLSDRPFGEDDIERARGFSKDWNFDLASVPGMEREEANRHHQLPSPLFYDTARALLAGEGEVPPEAAWHSLRSATDIRPYFWRSMRWKNLPELFRGFGSQSLIWLDWSLVILAVKLLAVTVLGILLILLPLGRLPRGSGPVTRPRVCVYFTSLGLGFLLLEMAFFQRAILVLGHPVLAASLVFAVFLAGAGLGSRSTPANASPRTVKRLFGGVAAGTLLGFVILMNTGHWAHVPRGPWPYVALGAVCLPLAWALGRPLPWGLRRLDAARPLIPWAWGINGFASVLAAPLASMLSVHFGQHVTWIAGLGCYAVAGLTALAWTTPSDTETP